MGEVIVRFGELSLKSGPVRKLFKKKLIRNLRVRIERQSFSIKIRKKRGRIFIVTENPREVAEVAANTFGVVSTSPCKKIDRDLDSMEKEAIKFASDFKSKEKFRIRVKRSDKSYKYDSEELERKLGARVLDEYGFEVDLEEPDFTIYLEVRKNYAYIFSKKIEGVGGLPEGVEGKVAALIEDKRDILASWLMMRRGVRIRPFLLGQEISYLRKWSAFDLDPIKVNRKEVTRQAKRENCKAVVSGKLFFDSEDLKDIKELEGDLKLPVIQPLVGYEEGEIKELWKEVRSI